jgi:ArsR family transcriptional regulator
VDKGVTEEVFAMHAQICQVLSDPKRLLIINQLRHGEHSVGELASTLGLRQANVSQHLALMRERGLLDTRREGATIYYSIAHPKIVQAFDLLREVLVETTQKRQALVSGLSGR